MKIKKPPTRAKRVKCEKILLINFQCALNYKRDLKFTNLKYVNVLIYNLKYVNL